MFWCYWIYCYLDCFCLISGEGDAQAAVVLSQRNRFIFHGQSGSTRGNAEAVQHQTEDAKLGAALVAWNPQLGELSIWCNQWKFFSSSIYVWNLSETQNPACLGCPLIILPWGPGIGQLACTCACTSLVVGGSNPSAQYQESLLNHGTHICCLKCLFDNKEIHMAQRTPNLSHTLPNFLSFIADFPVTFPSDSEHEAVLMILLKRENAKHWGLITWKLHVMKFCAMTLAFIEYHEHCYF